jgi:hypothetical protein
MFCAPSKGKRINNSCFNNNQVLQLCKSYNSTTKNKIQTAGRDIHHIYNDLKKRMNNIDEYLWLEDKKNTKYLSNKELKGIFIPKMPNEWCSDISNWRNQTNNSRINAPWLSNFDIDNVMKQYHNKYPNFMFLGTFPIDFQAYNLFGCVSNLCGFNIDNIVSKGKDSFGIVLNTDKHTQSGAHWISIFCNLKTNNIYFFNSASSSYSKIPPQVIKFVKSIQKQVHQLYHKKMKFKHNNKVRHQSSNSECGMYSIYFILSLLDAKDNSDSIFDQYFNNPTFKISDSSMVQKRFDYFRPNNKCKIK